MQAASTEGSAEAAGFMAAVDFTGAATDSAEPTSQGDFNVARGLPFVAGCVALAACRGARKTAPHATRTSTLFATSAMTRSKIALALLAVAVVLATDGRRADASTIVFTFRDGALELAVADDGTMQLHDKATGRSCATGSKSDASLLADFRGPEVQAALRANAVFGGDAARLIVGQRSIEWSPRARRQASYAVRLFHLELRTQALEAQIACASRHP